MKRGENVIRLLMKRDGIGEAEARRMYNDTRSEIREALSGTSCIDPEDVLASELGLEPDYIFDFI